MIGTTSSQEKAELALAAGATDVSLYTERDVVTEVRRLTGERGVDVVYDGVGADTFDASLDCLALRGMMVLYGAASGPVPPFDPQVLNAKGSLYLTRPMLAHYVIGDALLERATAVLDAVAAGELDVRIRGALPARRGRRRPLRPHVPAHTGKLLLP